jgi:hypothetical protein
MDLARVSCVLGAAIVVGGVSSATAAGLPVLIDSQGAVLLSGEALLAPVDLIALEPAVSSLSNAPSIGILQLVKFAA